MRKSGTLCNRLQKELQRPVLPANNRQQTGIADARRSARTRSPSGLIALTESLPAGRAHTASAGSTNFPAIPFWPSTYVFVSAFLASGLFFITPVQLPFYLRNAFDASPFEMGAAIAVGNTVGALISLVYYRFKRRMNFVGIYAFIFLTMAIGYFVVASASSYAIALLGMVLAGLGFGLYVPNHSSWILSIVSPKRRGFGVGLVTTAMFLGQFSAPILVQPFIDPTNPSAVWSAISTLLLLLGGVYIVLAPPGREIHREQRLKRTPWQRKESVLSIRRVLTTPR